jgi:spore germination protein YaaH
MKDPLFVEMIKKFILDKPGRPFDEVEAYAQKIGASEQDIKQAVFRVSEYMLNIDPQELTELEDHTEVKIVEVPVSPKKQKNPLARSSDPMVKIVKSVSLRYSTLVLASLFLVTGITLIVFRPSGGRVSTQKIAQTPGSAFAETASQLLGVPAVYAHQSALDTSQVFSVPSSHVTLHYTGTPKKEILGFFPYWVLDNEEKIHLDAVTTVALFGLEVDGRGNIALVYSDGTRDPGWSMWNDKKLDDFLSRTKRRGVKTVLTLKAFNNSNIEQLVRSDLAQKQFIANAVELVKMKSLNGINLDFEYTGTPDSTTRDGFTRMVANLSAELQRQVENSKLSVSTYLTSASNEDLFDLPKLSSFVDNFVVMGYDVHTPKGEPGPVAPLEGPNGISGALQSYVDRIESSKLILGVPYYGYDWVLGTEDTSQNSGVPYAIIAASKAKVLWDDATQTPSYRYKDGVGLTHEVHFENTQSLGMKYDYVNKNNLAGVALWAMGYEGDDRELDQLLLDKFAQ